MLLFVTRDCVDSRLLLIVAVPRCRLRYWRFYLLLFVDVIWCRYVYGLVTRSPVCCRWTASASGFAFRPHHVVPSTFTIRSVVPAFVAERCFAGLLSPLLPRLPRQVVGLRRLLEDAFAFTALFGVTLFVVYPLFIAFAVVERLLYVATVRFVRCIGWCYSSLRHVIIFWHCVPVLTTFYILCYSTLVCIVALFLIYVSLLCVICYLKLVRCFLFCCVCYWRTTCFIYYCLHLVKNMEDCCVLCHDNYTFTIVYSILLPLLYFVYSFLLHSLL